MCECVTVCECVGAVTVSLTNSVSMCARVCVCLSGYVTVRECDCNNYVTLCVTAGVTLRDTV